MTEQGTGNFLYTAITEQILIERFQIIRMVLLIVCNDGAQGIIYIFSKNIRIIYRLLFFFCAIRAAHCPCKNA